MRRIIYVNFPANKRTAGDKLAYLLNTLCIVAVTFTGMRYAVRSLAGERSALPEAHVYTSVYVSSAEVLPPIITPPSAEGSADECEAAAEPVEEVSAPAWVRPFDGEVTSAFASRSDPFGSGKLEYHTGIDLSSENGLDVRAFSDGTVTDVFYNQSYGNAVIIDHGDGLETLYAHCSEIGVAVGDRVSGGDSIAVAGETGRATAVHLHFEVRINGSAVDPYPYLCAAS